jgi:hypothetical protein
MAAACGSSDDGEAAAGGSTIRFESRAGEAGLGFKMCFLTGEQGVRFRINFYDHGAGVAVGDCDGDGDDDVYFLNQLGPNALYRNDGGGRFTDVTAESGPIGLGDRISVSAAFQDVDGDGDQDLYATSTRAGNVLFRNDGKGRFTDVTDEAGLAWVAHTQFATFFDGDGDGRLDLFVSNTAHWTSAYNPDDGYYEGASDIYQLLSSPLEKNAYFVNRGDGTFRNATGEAGLEGAGWGGDTAVFDCDEDGDCDLFVANMFGFSTLYRNDGKGRFADVTRETLGRTPWGTVAAKAFDYDGDGRLDLYLVDMHSDMWMSPSYDTSGVDEERKFPTFSGPMPRNPTLEMFAEKAKIPYPDVESGKLPLFFGNGLYRSAGGSRFEEVSDRAGAETFWAWGIAAGDYDNDGDVDVFLPSGMGFPFDYWRCPLLENMGDGTFQDCCESAGVEPPPGGRELPEQISPERTAYRSSRAAAVSDFDGDGRLDIVVNNFNDGPYLFLNRSPKRNFVAFRLVGTRSNRDAVGAVVRLRAAGRTQVRQVEAAGGYLAQSTKTVHFGLGDARAVESCEIRWPSGRVQKLPDVGINRTHVVTEPNE